MSICNVCGHHNTTDGALFCGKCGAKMETQEQKRICSNPNCENELESNMLFCDKCGTKCIDAEPIEPMPIPHPASTSFQSFFDKHKKILLGLVFVAFIAIGLVQSQKPEEARKEKEHLAATSKLNSQDASQYPDNKTTTHINTPPQQPTNNTPDKAKTSDTVSNEIGSTVYNFYDAISRKQYEIAYNCFSNNWKNKINYNKWVQGYDTTISNKIEHLLITNVTDNSAIANFRLSARDRDKGGVLVQVFEGKWQLVFSDNKWLLNEPDIRRVSYHRE